MPNRTKWDGKRERFYEVWYGIFTRPETGEAWWIRYTLTNPLVPGDGFGAGLWFSYVNLREPARSVAIVKHFPGSAFRREPVTVQGAVLASDAMRGALEDGGRRVSWDLHYAPFHATHYFFPGWLRAATKSISSVTMPNPLVLASGAIEIDGRATRLTDVRGHTCHHWGKKRAKAWCWAHCNDFEGRPDAIVEVLYPLLPPLPRPTFINLYLGGEHIYVGGFTGGKTSRDGRTWSYSGESATARVEATFVAPARGISKLGYVSPDASRSNVYSSLLSECTVRVSRRAHRFARFDPADTLKGIGPAEEVVPGTIADLEGSLLVS